MAAYLVVMKYYASERDTKKALARTAILLNAARHQISGTCRPKIRAFLSKIPSATPSPSPRAARPLSRIRDVQPEPTPFRPG